MIWVVALLALVAVGLGAFALVSQQRAAAEAAARQSRQGGQLGSLIRTAAPLLALI